MAKPRTQPQPDVPAELRLYDKHEIATLRGCHARCIERDVAAGILKPTHKDGRRLLYNYDTVRAYLDTFKLAIRSATGAPRGRPRKSLPPPDAPEEPALQQAG